MPIAKWEYWSVANMLISTHGEDAEEKADLQITTALEAGDPATVLVWRSIRDKVSEIRVERDRLTGGE